MHISHSFYFFIKIKATQIENMRIFVLNMLFYLKSKSIVISLSQMSSSQIRALILVHQIVHKKRSGGLSKKKKKDC
jgi:hypothetical protein